MDDRLLRMIAALRSDISKHHRIETYRVLQTHISCVVLTGEFAYKFKKPVDFGFVDFSTLEKRRHYCERELTLNRRLAAALYSTRMEV